MRVYLFSVFLIMNFLGISFANAGDLRHVPVFCTGNLSGSLNVWKEVEIEWNSIASYPIANVMNVMRLPEERYPTLTSGITRVSETDGTRAYDGSRDFNLRVEMNSSSPGGDYYPATLSYSDPAGNTLSESLSCRFGSR